MAQRFTVLAPLWREWQGALDRASPGGQVDAQRVLEECLLTCLRSEAGGRVTRTDLQALSAQEGDELLTEALALMDRQRDELNIQVDERLDGAVLGGLRLRAWSFGERNEALRRALSLVGGQVVLDPGAYELAMVLACVTTVGGDRLTVDAVTAWSVPLGEAVMAALDRLNGLEPQYGKILAECVRSGQEHPDLSLMRLCQSFGWTPDQAQRLDARLAERLLVGLGALTAPPEAPASADREGVIRIVVNAD